MAKAHSKNIGYSSYKMRRVINQIRSKSVFEAKLQLNLLGTPLAKEILKMSNYGKHPVKYNNQLKMELGDVLYSIITIANVFEIDLDEALNKVLEKYQKRVVKESPSSNND